MQTAAFTNTYSAEGEGEAKVQKTLSGRDWTTDDAFEFTIAPVGTAPAFTNPKVTVTKDSADYTESFGKVTFTAAGTYQWTVSETHKGETIDGVAYAADDKTITIVVVDDGKGHLVADNGSALVQTAAFTNTYSAEGEGEIRVRKVLSGRAWTYKDSFKFTLKALDGAPLPAQTSITITRDDSDHIRSFGTIVFTEPGIYVYAVRESKGHIADIRYDTKEHRITIEVVDDGHGNLVAKGDSQLIQTVTIKNTHTDVPETGDNRHLFLYTGLMITSMTGLAFLCLTGRLKKRKE